MWPTRVAANSRWMDIYTMDCSSHFEKNMPIVGIQQSHHPPLTVIIGGIESQYLRAHTKQLHSALQLICTRSLFLFLSISKATKMCRKYARNWSVFDSICICHPSIRVQFMFSHLLPRPAAPEYWCSYFQSSPPNRWPQLEASSRISIRHFPCFGAALWNYLQSIALVLGGQNPTTKWMMNSAVQLPFWVIHFPAEYWVWWTIDDAICGALCINNGTEGSFDWFTDATLQLHFMK